MAKKATKFEVARELVGGEIPDWMFEKQLKALTNILESLHDTRPLMTVQDMLNMLERLHVKE